MVPSASFFFPKKKIIIIITNCPPPTSGKFGRCRSCTRCCGFETSALCVVCDKRVTDHETRWETAAERRARGLPTGDQFLPLHDQPELAHLLWADGSPEALERAKLILTGMMAADMGPGGIPQIANLARGRGRGSRGRLVLISGFFFFVVFFGISFISFFDQKISFFSFSSRGIRGRGDQRAIRGAAGSSRGQQLSVRGSASTSRPRGSRPPPPPGQGQF
jgi:hypothetical protein